ncbi:MAG: hypothetical protein LBD86_03235 [Spirochaetaceae bacterium]|jgi:hypothetical protein|nr:hypothetical protein [Spirochaetaceae bacterium]
MEQMTAAEAAEWGKSLSFEKVWAMMAETDRVVKETSRIVAETSKELAKMGRKVDHVCGNLGGLGNRFGEMIESMVLPNLIDKFGKLNLHFTRVQRDAKIKDPAHNICTEVDAFLENGEKAAIVEIKSKPDKYDIDYHLWRMEKLREYADLHDDKRKYLGAIAGVTFGEDERNYALEQGFYVIEPSGDTFNITVPEGNPREW